VRSSSCQGTTQRWTRARGAPTARGLPPRRTTARCAHSLSGPDALSYTPSRGSHWEKARCPLTHAEASPFLTGARAKALCLLIHPGASLSHPGKRHPATRRALSSGFLTLISIYHRFPGARMGRGLMVRGDHAARPRGHRVDVRVELRRYGLDLSIPW